MSSLRTLWGLTGTLLATVYLYAAQSSASSAVDVALRTSFSSAPYLLQLLETAADENSTSYISLLDRIADGYFSAAKTDKDLYDSFIKVLKDDGHLDDPAAFSSFQLALSLQSAAPRIEAHYQYYDTAVQPTLDAEDSTSCPTWVLFNDAQYCSPTLDKPHGKVGAGQTYDLQFDRAYGETSAPASILYADITSPTFGLFHKTLIKTAREGKSYYRLRHRRPMSHVGSPLQISGYGVELALKRTDYIVIDDREDESKPVLDQKSAEVGLDDEALADLSPLSSSELLTLGLKASSFVMQSENPFRTLVKLSQDFPKFSAAIATFDTSADFLSEHTSNRGKLVPAGLNVLWLNGMQVMERQIDAFSLLNILRNERELINKVKNIGLTAAESITLLSHDEIMLARANDEVPRYDWTDLEEGGNVIIWLNNIEKDKRYEEWTTTLSIILQPTFQGQFPTIRRDIFNVIFPVDLTKSEDVRLVIEQLRGFVKRKLPLRFGIVPITRGKAASDHAKIIYHLIESYGISATLGYLEASYGSKKLSSASKAIFDVVRSERTLRSDKVARTFEEVLETDEYQTRVASSQEWVSRLGADGAVAPFIVNGVVLPRDESWLQVLSGRMNVDLPFIQQAVFDGKINSEDWIPQHFLSGAVRRRNPLIISEDSKTLVMIDVDGLHRKHSDLMERLPRLPAAAGVEKSNWAHMILLVDLTTSQGQRLLGTTSKFREANPGVDILIVHTVESVGAASNIFFYLKNRSFAPMEDIGVLRGLVEEDRIVVKGEQPSKQERQESEEYFLNTKEFIKASGLKPGQHGILINGRLVGPIPENSKFSLEDFEQLLAYERSLRILPAYRAIEAMGLSEKISNPLSGARLTSIIALSTPTDGPEGIYEQSSKLRINSFDIFESNHTAIEVGDPSTAVIRIVALVDPASELSQRSIPILKVLSEMDGIYLKLYLNPKDKLKELPVKRFYRYVLESSPRFDEVGNLLASAARFNGVPQEALLTVGMDVPPSWLVAPKDSLHDLDNIKLSNIKTDVEAIYELEHILIEGHSREVPGTQAPRGAQLILGTERDPHFADTIIMANLGYFQFKANPGFYHIDLQKGRSSEIFDIDGLGQSDWPETSTVERNTVALMSFQGTTLFPRLSRRAGQEMEDVLEIKLNSTLDTVSQGLAYAKTMLGFGKAKTQALQAPAQAEINIFSVASGHLYERMLNIMMVSVMKHTKHTVKFWFIEQFLSPSFKDSIPYVAEEFGFQYEMVTYKWPHWLRAQKEKQREIWGYKILFLDVLFPLSLDKVIFVDADQIVRTDMIELVNHDLKGAPYGFTPMCDSRTEMEGFRFWKQGYWKNYLKELPYHISALYVVDLKKFRQIAAGDRLRQQYHQLSADPGSLSNLDQDLPNHMQTVLPIHSLPQEWLWCETWCSDESLKDAKTIDLCNNPLTKEPKLDRARRQVPEWTVYDDEIAAALKRKRAGDTGAVENVETGDLTETERMKNSKSRSHEEVVGSHKVDEL